MVSNKGMSSPFGIMFSGVTLAEAIAPTFFGFLAEAYGFWTSLIFLEDVAFISFSLIVLFLVTFRSYMMKIESSSYFKKDNQNPFGIDVIFSSS